MMTTPDARKRVVDHQGEIARPPLPGPEDGAIVGAHDHDDPPSQQPDARDDGA